MKGCPEGGEQSFLFTLYSELCEGRCPCPYECGFSVSRQKSDFFAIFVSLLCECLIASNYYTQDSFPEYIAHLRSMVRQKCQTCSKEFCFACGEPVNTQKIPIATTSIQDDLFHCSNLQGVILGIGLAMVEHLYQDQITNTSGSSDSKGRTSKRRKLEALENSSMPADGDDDDDSYLTPPTQGRRLLAYRGGTGYAGDQKEDVSRPHVQNSHVSCSRQTTGQAEAQANQKVKDVKLGELLSCLREYLPSLHRPGGARTSDYLVHPTALAHLRRRFNNICSSLLRNDSLTDMSDRSVVYIELFGWLEVCWSFSF